MALLSSLIAQNLEDTPSKLVNLQLFLDNIGSGSGLGGTNYVFVRGDGTPEENAVELQEAYNRAKTMPIYRGLLSGVKTFYIGQTFESSENNIFYKVTANYTGNVSEVVDFAVQVTEKEAKSTRTTVIVAPGDYIFTAPFTVDTPYINIVSLTGNPDVLLNAISVTADNVYLKGLSSGVDGEFEIGNNLDNLICENCQGGDNSFGAGGIASGTFRNCTGGKYSFGGDSGSATGTFTNCTGGDYSFGGDSGSSSGIFYSCVGGQKSFGGEDGITAGTFYNCIGAGGSFGSEYGSISGTARLYYCRLTAGTFPDPATGGKLISCIDGTGKVVNTDSQLSYRVYSGLFTQNGTSAPVVTVIENTLGVTPVWQRTDAGSYSCTIALAGTIICLQDKNIFRSSGTEGQALILGSGGLGVWTRDMSNDTMDGVPSDDVLSNTFIEFRVYN